MLGLPHTESSDRAQALPYPSATIGTGSGKAIEGECPSLGSLSPLEAGTVTRYLIEAREHPHWKRLVECATFVAGSSRPRLNSIKQAAGYNYNDTYLRWHDGGPHRMWRPR